jgi:hypothetical protein
MIFHMNFEIDRANWEVQCIVTNVINEYEQAKAHALISHGDEDVATVQVMHAKYDDLRLDEHAWRMLLREHDLTSTFCTEVMNYLSFLLWTMTHPRAQA